MKKSRRKRAIERERERKRLRRETSLSAMTRSVLKILDGPAQLGKFKFDSKSGPWTFPKPVVENVLLDVEFMLDPPLASRATFHRASIWEDANS